MKKGRPTLATLAVEWSPQGVHVYDIQTRQHLQFATLSEAGGQFSGRTAILAVSRRSLFVRTARLPDSDHETLRQILSIRAADIFPVTGVPLALDFATTSDINEEGRLALVVAMPIPDLQRVRSEAGSAGIRIAQVVPIAVGSAMLARALEKGTAAIVSRESAGIGIDLVQDGELRYSRIVPASAHVPSEVCRTYTVAGLTCGDTVSVGGVGALEADVETVVTPLESLLETGSGEIPFNLELPEEVAQRRRAEKASKVRFAALLTISALGLLAVAANDYSQAANKVAALEKIEDSKLSKLTQIQKEYEKDAADAVKVQESLTRAFEPAQLMSDMVTVVSNSAPTGIWLTGISADRGKPIIVRGTSQSSEAVATYLEKLGTEKRFRDVKLVFANNVTIDEQPLVQFSISAFPVGNLPLIDMKANRTKKADTR